VSQHGEFHVLTVGWVDDLGREIQKRTGIRFSFIAHPRHTPGEFAGRPPADTYFFRSHLRTPMPVPDRQLLASLERDDLPSVHNMILGDSVLARLPYEDVLGYATFMARRLRELFEQIRPDVVITSFDGLHSALALAVARSMGIPWFVLNFSVLPPGLACFCDTLMPVSRVAVAPPLADLREIAANTLRAFEERSLRAPAYITPPGLSLGQMLARLPQRLGMTLRTLRAARDREYLRFTEHVTAYDFPSALRHLTQTRRARRAAAELGALTEPPQRPYVFFGLHTQPESAIDVWAPFYSDQYWVVQALARALPPSHALLVKIHKSDAAKYSPDDLRRLKSMFGVELVAPFADGRRFVDLADLVIGIQGTMGLEGALLGKPVLMLGDSPVNMFPSAERIGELSTLPTQIRRLLSKPRPTREAILDAFTEFLAPFRPAAHNDWTVAKTPQQFDAFAEMFVLLRDRLQRAEVRRSASQ
jgi:capsular polysaccharide biosynthesis protein